MSFAAPGAPEAPAAGDAPSPAAGDGGLTSMLQTVQDLWRELPGLLSDRVELLTLELQRAGQALAQMMMWVVATVIVAVTAWILLWGLIVAMLARTGLDLPWALLGAVVLNVLMAVLAVARLRALLPRLLLPATRRHLTLRPSAKAPSVGTQPERHERPELNPQSVAP